MSKFDEDAVWKWVPTAELDEDGELFGDYVLAGSEPLTPFEAMVFAAAGASVPYTPNPYTGV